MSGMNHKWIIGPRVVSTTTKGKNGGFTVKQSVCKLYTPKKG